METYIAFLPPAPCIQSSIFHNNLIHLHRHHASPSNPRRERERGRGRRKRTTTNAPTWVCRKGRNSNSSSSTLNTSGRNRSAKRTQLYEAMTEYASHFTQLLEWELEAEQQAHDSIQQSSSLRLSVARKKRLFSSDVYALSCSQPLRHVNVAKGDLIDLFMFQDRQCQQRVAQGTVLSKSTSQILITVPLGSDSSKAMRSLCERHDDGDGDGDGDGDNGRKDDSAATSNYVNELRMQIGMNTLLYERAQFALQCISKKGPGTSNIAKLFITSFYDIPPSFSSSSSSITDIYDNNNNKRLQSESESFIYETLANERPDNFHHNHDHPNEAQFNHQNVKNAMKNIPKQALNDSQRAAIQSTLLRRLSLIQGPPGTGKTLTIAYLIQCMLSLNMSNNTPILAIASSNSAVDNLTRRILSVCGKSNVIRVGRPSVIASDLWPACLDSILEQNQHIQRKRQSVLSNASRGGTQMKELIQLEQDVSNQILNRAHVVCATCVTCGNALLLQRSFNIVVVDEATQSTETDLLIALCRDSKNQNQNANQNVISAKQIILVGDHFQLPPTTLSKKQRTFEHNDTVTTVGLETSLFSRLYAVGIKSFLLNVQYRMHPSISQFPNIHFYSRRLKNGVQHSDRLLQPIYKLPPWITSTKDLDKKRLFLLDVQEGHEEYEENKNRNQNQNQNQRSTSLLNKNEAHIISNVVKSLLMVNDTSNSPGDTFQQHDICVLSPYAAQVRLIRDVLHEQKVHDIEVNSVDGFQGREQKVVVISTVRSNYRSKVGFLNDWRRLNVAITRAKLLVIVVCNLKTVKADKHWRAYVSFIGKHGYVINTNLDKVLSLKN